MPGKLNPRLYKIEVLGKKNTLSVNENRFILLPSSYLPVRIFALNLTAIIIGLSGMMLVPAIAFCSGIASVVAASGPLGPVISKDNQGRDFIDIQNPNAQGLSHNQYEVFHVNHQGAVLNNTTAQADIILNEVTGTDLSNLNGLLSVQGKTADVIVSNPNGINCNGCGFVNSSRGVLITGKPILEGDRLAALEVSSGRINIREQGLMMYSTPGINPGKVDLIARGVTVTGNIRALQSGKEMAAGEIQIIAGSNRVIRVQHNGHQHINHYHTDALLPQAHKDNNAAVHERIDIAGLGGMYAGQIYLQGSDAGIGVSSSAVIKGVENLKISTKGSLYFHAPVRASENITLRDAHTFINISNLQAGKNLMLHDIGQVINGKSITIGNAQQVPAVVSDHTRMTARNINIAAREFYNSASITADNNFTLKAQKIDNISGSLIADALHIDAHSLNHQTWIFKTNTDSKKQSEKNYADIPGTVARMVGHNHLLIKVHEDLNMAGSTLASSQGSVKLDVSGKTLITPVIWERKTADTGSHASVWHPEVSTVSFTGHRVMTQGLVHSTLDAFTELKLSSNELTIKGTLLSADSVQLNSRLNMDILSFYLTGSADRIDFNKNLLPADNGGYDSRRHVIYSMPVETRVQFGKKLTLSSEDSAVYLASSTRFFAVADRAENAQDSQLKIRALKVSTVRQPHLLMGFPVHADYLTMEDGITRTINTANNGAAFFRQPQAELHDRLLENYPDMTYLNDHNGSFHADRIHIHSTGSSGFLTDISLADIDINARRMELHASNDIILHKTVVLSGVNSLVVAARRQLSLQAPVTISGDMHIMDSEKFVNTVSIEAAKDLYFSNIGTFENRSRIRAGNRFVLNADRVNNISGELTANELDIYAGTLIHKTDINRANKVAGQETRKFATGRTMPDSTITAMGDVFSYDVPVYENRTVDVPAQEYKDVPQSAALIAGHRRLNINVRNNLTVSGARIESLLGSVSLFSSGAMNIGSLSWEEKTTRSKYSFNLHELAGWNFWKSLKTTFTVDSDIRQQPLRAVVSAHDSLMMSSSGLMNIRGASFDGDHISLVSQTGNIDVRSFYLTDSFKKNATTKTEPVLPVGNKTEQVNTWTVLNTPVDTRILYGNKLDISAAAGSVTLGNAYFLHGRKLPAHNNSQLTIAARAVSTVSQPHSMMQEVSSELLQAGFGAWWNSSIAHVINSDNNKPAVYGSERIHDKVRNELALQALGNISNIIFGDLVGGSISLGVRHETSDTWVKNTSVSNNELYADLVDIRSTSGNIELSGTDIHATRSTLLLSATDIILGSGQQSTVTRATGRTVTSGVEVGGGISAMSTGGATDFGFDVREKDAINRQKSYRPFAITSEFLELIAGKNISVNGGHMNVAGKLKLRTGWRPGLQPDAGKGDLSITSLQETSTSSSTEITGGARLGVGVNTRFGLIPTGNLQGGYGRSAGHVARVPVQAGMVVGAIDGEIQGNLYLNGGHMIARDPSSSFLKVWGVAHARKIEDYIDKNGWFIGAAAGVSKSGNPNIKVDYISGDKQYYRATNQATLAGMKTHFVRGTQGVFNDVADRLVLVEADDSKSAIPVQFTVNYLSYAGGKKNKLLLYSPHTIALLRATSEIKTGQQSLGAQITDLPKTPATDRQLLLTSLREANQSAAEVIFKAVGHEDALVKQKVTEIESDRRELVEQLTELTTVTSGFILPPENKQQHARTLQSLVDVAKKPARFADLADIVSKMEPYFPPGYLDSLSESAVRTLIEARIKPELEIMRENSLTSGSLDKSQPSLNRQDSSVSSNSGGAGVDNRQVLLYRPDSVISDSCANPAACYRSGADSSGSSDTPEITVNTPDHQHLFVRQDSSISGISGNSGMNNRQVSLHRPDSVISGSSGNALAFYRGGANSSGSSDTPEIAVNTINGKHLFSRLDSRFSQFSNYSASNTQDYTARHENAYIAKNIDRMRGLDDAATGDFMSWHVAVDNVQAQATSLTRFQTQPHIIKNTMLVMTQDDRVNFLREIQYRNHAGFYEKLPGNEASYTSLQQYNYVEFDRSGATRSGKAYVAYNVISAPGGVYNVAHLSRVTTDPY